MPVRDLQIRVEKGPVTWLGVRLSVEIQLGASPIIWHGMKAIKRAKGGVLVRTAIRLRVVLLGLHGVATRQNRGRLQ